MTLKKSIGEKTFDPTPPDSGTRGQHRVPDWLGQRKSAARDQDGRAKVILSSMTAFGPIGIQARSPHCPTTSSPTGFSGGKRWRRYESYASAHINLPIALARSL
jgi:hypothetical protein